MNINTVFLFLLVVAAYLNLYLGFKKMKMQKKTNTAAISSKNGKRK